MSRIEGGCLCGAVRYQATGGLASTSHCHCLDCRRSVGAAFVTWCSFPAEDFRVTQGEIHEFEFAERWRGFCPQCGTALTFRDAPGAAEVDVTVASFDQAELATPAVHIWTEDRLPWITLADGLPTHAKGRS